MREWLFLISGFGLLLVEEKPGNFGPYASSGSLRVMIYETLHLLWQVVILLLAYFFMIEMWVPKGQEKEPMILFFWLAAYGLRKICGRSTCFFLSVFGLCLFVMNQGLGFSLWERLGTAARLVLGVGFFQSLLLGLKNKLLFSSLPQAWAGLPILFLTGALLGLALLGLQGIVLY